MQTSLWMGFPASHELRIGDVLEIRVLGADAGSAQRSLGSVTADSVLIGEAVPTPIPSEAVWPALAGELAMERDTSAATASRQRNVAL